MKYNEMAKEFLDVAMSAPSIKINRSMENLIKGGMYVLGYLYYHDNKAYPKELSDSLSVSSARMAVILNSLEKDGLIKRRMDYVDNRKTVVTLTEKGYKKIESENEDTIQYISSLLEALGEDDAREYIRIHRKMARVFS